MLYAFPFPVPAPPSGAPALLCRAGGTVHTFRESPQGRRGLSPGTFADAGRLPLPVAPGTSLQGAAPGMGPDAGFTVMDCPAEGSARPAGNGRALRRAMFRAESGPGSNRRPPFHAREDMPRLPSPPLRLLPAGGPEPSRRSPPPCRRRSSRGGRFTARRSGARELGGHAFGGDVGCLPGTTAPAWAPEPFRARSLSRPDGGGGFSRKPLRGRSFLSPAAGRSPPPFSRIKFSRPPPD
jgi:hypothetical protein